MNFVLCILVIPLYVGTEMLIISYTQSVVVVLSMKRPLEAAVAVIKKQVIRWMAHKEVYPKSYCSSAITLKDFISGVSAGGGVSNESTSTVVVD